VEIDSQGNKTRRMIMERFGRIFLVFLVSSTLITGCVARKDFEQVQSDLVNTQSQLQTAQSDYNTLKTEQESLSSDFQALKSEKEKLQSDLDALTGEKQALADQLKAAEAKLSTAELGRKSAEIALKTTRERVAKAKIEAEILDLLFSPLWGIYRSLITHSKASEIRDMLDKLIADANDAELSEKFTAMSDSSNNSEAVLDFLVYLVGDLAKQLR
jgi:chromosome segregation ATPase